ncbi:uncharacterized protein LOC105698186 isoform X2 [Orussus abietinus]|nr:uncharacterized protein LOC105698186 isoform X2 [Orussus abietinus]
MDYGSYLEQYDKISVIKLYFAMLQYPVIKFYTLDEEDNCSTRQLLLAFAWICGTQNSLNNVILSKIKSSSFGKEYSEVNINLDLTSWKEQSISLENQMSNLGHQFGKINHNLKEITELVIEKTKLTAKIHTASVNVCNLPHLSVWEMALNKSLSTCKEVNYPDRCKQQLNKLQLAACMINTHQKWTNKQHVFFSWMITVIEEQSKHIRNDLSETSYSELFKFINLLRHLVKHRLHNLKYDKSLPEHFKLKSTCVARFLRVQKIGSEVQNWFSEAKDELQHKEKQIAKNDRELAIELKTIMQLIPHCIQI